MANPLASKGERLLVTAVALAALLMLALATPRLVAGTLAALALPEGGAVQSLPGLAEAQSWSWSARVAEHQVWGATAAGTPGLRPLVEDALARAPINPSHWTVLSDLRHRDGDVAGAVAAMRLSLLSGPADPALAPFRLAVALRLRDAMDDDDRALVDRQIQLSYVLRPGHVHALTADPRMREPIRAAIDTLSPMDIQHMVRIHALH